jgi:hypothetical protein
MTVTKPHTVNPAMTVTKPHTVNPAMTVLQNAIDQRRTHQLELVKPESD